MVLEEVTQWNDKTFLLLARLFCAILISTTQSFLFSFLLICSLMYYHNCTRCFTEHRFFWLSWHTIYSWETPACFFAFIWLWRSYRECFWWNGLFNCQDNLYKRKWLILSSPHSTHCHFPHTLTLLCKWFPFFTQCSILIAIPISQMKVCNERNWHYTAAIIHSLEKDKNENWQQHKINPFPFQCFRLQWEPGDGTMLTHA